VPPSSWSRRRRNPGIASIATRSKHLAVFQRQSHWVIPNLFPRQPARFGDSERWLRRHLPTTSNGPIPAFWQMNVISYQITKSTTTGSRPLAVDLTRERHDHADEPSTTSRHLGEGSDLARKLTPDFDSAGSGRSATPADRARRLLLLVVPAPRRPRDLNALPGRPRGSSLPTAPFTSSMSSSGRPL